MLSNALPATSAAEDVLSDHPWAWGVTDLIVRLGGNAAIRELTVQVPAGVTGLIGPNGAGKTTLMRALTGDLRPASGEVRVNTGGWISMVPAGDALPPGSRLMDFALHMARVSRMPEDEARSRATELIDYVGLSSQRDALIGTFSLGMRQRAKIAVGLIGDPALLLLDEPTTGLDPDGRVDILELVRTVYEGVGTSVLLSSHLLGDIAKVCDFVVEIDQGQLVGHGPTRRGPELGEVWQVRVVEALTSLPPQDLVDVMVVRGHGVVQKDGVVTVIGAGALQDLVKECASRGWGLLSAVPTTEAHGRESQTSYRKSGTKERST